MTEATIPGKSILSTIHAMKSLGSLGSDVLSSLGIDSIAPEKQYPISVRSSIHDEALRRFGKDALLSFGGGSFDDFPEYEKKLHKLWSDARKKKETVEGALDQYLGDFTNLGNEMLKTGTIGGAVKYYIKRKKIGVLEYETEFVTATPIRHAAFWEANFQAHAVYILSEFFSFNVSSLIDKFDEGPGWGKIVLREIYKVKELKGDINENKFKYRNGLNEKLISAVVGDANRQMAEAKSQKDKTIELSNQLGKYIPPQIHQAMLEGNYDRNIATRRKKLTIFFSDIKNFTSTSEGLQPEDLTKYLNEYFSEMTSVALDCGATIDKYIGDAMMVFFGDPESKGEREDARAAVEMSLRMQERLKVLQEKWRNEGFSDPFQVRIGLNTGYCNVGNFGSEQRLTYTIIGSEVNVAQRLESNADAGGILLSYETYAHAQDMIEVEQIAPITMKGINREIKLFAVKGRKTNTKRKSKKTSEFSQAGVLNNAENEMRDQIEKRLQNLELRMGESDRRREAQFKELQSSLEDISQAMNRGGS